MKYIWSYLRRYPKWLLLDFLGAIFFVVVNLGLPTVLARMIDEGINQGDTSRLYFWAFIMLLVIVAGVFGRIVLSYAAGKLTTSMVRDMRNDLYAKLQEYSHHEYEQIGVSSLVTRITSDAFVLMQFAEQSLKMGVITPMMMLSSVFMIFLTSPSLAWIVAISLPFLAVVVWYVAVKTRPLSEKQQKTLDKINQYARENLTGLRVIRAFAREEFQEERFASENEIYADNSNKLFKLTGLTEPLFVQIIIAMIVAIVWFALQPLGSGELRIGDLVAFIEYSFHALLSFLFLSSLFYLKSVRERYEKIKEIKQKEKEQRQLQLYTDEIVQLYNEIRGFRHDYASMLISLQTGINTGDMKEVENIFHNVLKKANLSLRSDDYTFFELNNVKDTALRSVMIQTIFKAREHEIEILFEVKDEIERLPMNLLDLVRVASVLLNNAVEGAAESTSKSINISLVNLENEIIFVIQNSRQSRHMNIEEIYEMGFSTKGKNRGLGLSNVKEIISKYEDIILETDITSNSFIQVLIFKRREIL